MDVISFIISIVVLFIALGLKKRVEHLEHLIESRTITSHQEAVSGAPSVSSPTPLESLSQSVPFEVGVPITKTVEIEHPSLFDAFGRWIQEDWLMKLGALLLLIGFGWLVRYAFLNNWIGPAGRITLGIACGVLFLAGGWWRMRRFISQGSVFLVLGSGIVLLSIFAARFLYDFFTPLSALIVMFLSVVFVALLSVRFRVRSLSLVSLVLCGVVPLLTHPLTTDYVGLFSYLLVVVIGATWIVAFTGWRILTPASLILVSFYSAQHFTGFVSKDNDILLLFAYAFTAVFFLTSVLGSVRSFEEDPQTDAITAAGVGLFLLAWVMSSAPAEWQSLILVAWMIVFSAGAFFIFKTTAKRVPFFAYAAVSAALLASATALELEGAWLIIAYIIESACISVVIYAALHDAKLALRSTLLLVGPAILSLESITAREWRSSILHEHFFVLLLFGSVLCGLGMFFGKRADAEQTADRMGSALLLIFGSIYYYALLWLGLHAGLQNDDTAVMIALAVYTVIGIGCYFYQETEGLNRIRAYGGALLGFVVARLLIIDVWNMALTGRIITFFIIGLLLMSTAFLWRKKAL